MPLVEEDAVDDALDRLIQRRVVEDDVGGLATQFQREPLAGAGDCALNLLADLRRTGEGDLVDVRMLRDEPPGRGTARDNVDDARRKVGLLTNVGEGEGGERGGFGRLEHHGVAGGQRGSHLPGEHEQREVPRDDLTGDAVRAGPGAQPGVLQFVGPSGVIEEVRGGKRDVHIAGLANRLAVVQRL